MKTKRFGRALSLALVLCMLLALLPTSVFAVTTVTPNTGSSSTDDLQVEYFSSTLYNWDEDAANKATAEADVADDGEVSYSAVSLSYNRNTDYSGYANNGYYYLTGGNYYLVTSLSASNRYGTTTWTIGYNSTSTTTTGNLTLYTMSTSYEGKGFYFTSSGNKASSVPSFSEWSGSEQNYYIYSGLAASKLSESSNAPFNDETVNAANLFATDGSNTGYTNVYTDVQVPFVYDSTTGYYTLDSDKYAVYFTNGTGASGATMEIADKPAGYSANVASGSICGFAPFNAVNLNSTGSYVMGNSSSSETTTGYTISGSMNYGFGMVTSVDFQMTDDGQINGEDIVFEFSGDDDVWVYIDGILVLDIGGTHDAINGKINFRTGEVTLTAPKYSQIGDKATDSSMSNPSSSLSQTNLYTALETTLTGFSSEGTHTMTIYYMDRGQGATNCLIKFNLPQEDSLSVTKDIGDYYLDEDHNVIESEDGVISSDVMDNLSNIDFTFTLYNNGEAVANANYSLYDSSGTFVQTGSTDSNGQFTLKNGQTAVFNGVDLDEAGTWQVVENLDSERWETTSTYTAVINNASNTDNSGTATGGLVTLTETYKGSNLSADSISYTFTNSCQRGPDPDVDIYDETIVLDYGLPVSVDVMANDVVTNYGEVITSGLDGTVALGLTEGSVKTTDESVTVTVIEGYDADNYTGTVENGVFYGTYGNAEVVDGEIVYTLTQDFCGIEKVPYFISAMVTVEDTDGNKETKQTVAYGTLTIIPATSVYYEENFSYTGSDTDFTSTNVSSWNKNSNFITISTNYANFTETGTSLTDYQETGLVGTTTDSTYGTDEVYLDNLGDSYGTSLKVDTSEGAAQYTYTFTGTGTTIYGRVSNKTGYIRVTVYAVDEDGNVGTKPVDTQYIDTVNLVTSSDETDEDAKSILEKTLYNIPIYQNTTLPSESASGYGTYVVKIYVYTANTPTDGGNKSGSEFYLDGIRVYNPMGTSTDDTGVDYTTAASAYATDGEANVSVVNIHDKITGDDEAGLTSGIFTLTDIDGDIMIVKSSEEDSEEDAEDEGNTYVDIGPNQEFYLKSGGYTMTFALVNWSSTSYKLYLGLKAPTGDATSVTFNTYVLDEEDTPSEMGTIDVYNSADCYYDISSYVDVRQIEVGEDEDGNTEYMTVGFVTITSSSDNLVALTNIKVTGVDVFELDYATDENYDDEGNGTGAVSTVYVANSAFAASLLTEDEEEVQVFEPSSIKLSCSYASLTKKATVTVSTSTDVAYVTINGTKVTGTSTAGGKLKFSKSFTKVTKGTTYEVIAYDSNGVASETYTVTAK